MCKNASATDGTLVGGVSMGDYLYECIISAIVGNISQLALRWPESIILSTIVCRPESDRDERQHVRPNG